MALESVLTAPQGAIALSALSFFAPLAITLFFTQKKRSLPLYFLLLVVLTILFDVPAIPGFAIAVGYRYNAAKTALPPTQTKGLKPT